MSFMLCAAASRDTSFEGHEKCLSLALQADDLWIAAEYGCDCSAGGQCQCVVHFVQASVSAWWQLLVNA